jgi:hypothetical protein
MCLFTHGNAINWFKSADKNADYHAFNRANIGKVFQFPNNFRKKL